LYDQALSVEAAITDIVAIRQQYQEGSYAAISDNGGASHAASQYEHKTIGNSSLQESFAGLSIASAPRHMVCHRKFSQHGNHLLTEDKPRSFDKGSRRSRHRQHSNQGSKPSNGNVHKDSNKLHYPGPNRPVTNKSYGVGGNTQQAFNTATQGHKLPAPPVLQSGFHYNSFGASIPGVVHQHASKTAAKGPALHATRMSQSGYHFNPQHVSNRAAVRHVLPAMQIPQSGFLFNPQGAAWDVAPQYTSHLTAGGPTLPAVMGHQSGFSFNSHVASAAQKSSLTITQGPTLYTTSFPVLNYYGPSFCMPVEQQKRIMTANGIKLPATYIPDPRYYHGPLHWLVAPVAQAIVTAAEASQHPTFPYYRPRGQLAHDTMLPPCALPPQCYIPGTSQMDIHIAECTRYIEMMQEVLAIPGNPEHDELPMTWYRILGAPRLRRVQPVWHPAVIDLYGQESQYEQLLVRDVNHRNNNEKGVGRKNALSNWQSQPSASMRTDKVSHQAIQQGPSIRGDKRSQKTPAMMHARHESEDTSIFFRDKRTPSSYHTNLHYLGYTLRAKRGEELSPELSPTPPSRGRSTQPFAGKTLLSFNRNKSTTYGKKRAFSATKTPLNTKRPSSSTYEGESSASKTPLLDFDSRYTAKHGEGDDVDFALRDLGPPRFGGKTFNEAIGFTPSSEKVLGSSAPFAYPVNVLRRPRD